jgi:hypothetical protein
MILREIINSKMQLPFPSGTVLQPVEQDDGNRKMIARRAFYHGIIFIAMW